MQPGWVDGQLQYWSAWIDSRLAKRYATPFDTPYPVAVKGWLNRLVTLRVYLRRGVDPGDRQVAEIKLDAESAQAEIKEAADAKDGLYELPLRADTTAGGVKRGTPRVYSEASPYVGFDVQKERGRREDGTGSGLP